MKQFIITIALGLYLANTYGQDASKDSLVREVDQYLNKKLTPAERIKAIEPYAIIYEESQVEQFKDIVLNEKVLPEVRATALSKIHAYAQDDQRIISLALGWLGDPKAPKVLRYEALQFDEDV